MKKNNWRISFLLTILFCTQSALATPTTPTSDFFDNGDGTVTHKLTGLVWMRCSMGQTWDKATASCTGTVATYTWDAAVALKSNFAGKSDWRLPNVTELTTIVERENTNPAINNTIFPNTPSSPFWSSSCCPYAGGWGLTVRFDTGNGSTDQLGWYLPVRLAHVGLDLTKANCRYVAPLYNSIRQQMRIKKALSCQAALNYYTWTKFTHPENNIASDYYSNRLNNINTSNQLFNQRLELIDNSLSVVEDVLDPDLRALLTPKTYTKSLKFMKSKGIVKSLAKGTTPFSRKSPTGRLLDKFFKEELLAKTSGTAFCSVMFKDNPAVSKSCTHETEKAFACAAGLLTKFDSITAPISIWKDAATCVTGGFTSFAGFVKNIFDVGQIIDIKQHTYGYILINDYLNDYYAKGSTNTALDEAKLEADIQKYADNLSLSSGGLFTFADFDMQFVKDGIRDSILRNLVTANANVRTVEQIRAILYK